jgi:hypothetical protein
MKKINWKEESEKAGTGERTVFPTGTYRVEATGWQECKSTKGTDQIRWFTTVRDPDEWSGKTLVEHTALTENALFRIAGLVSAFGIDCSKVPNMEVGGAAFKAVLDACIGRTAYWQVRYDEEYKNNKVDKFVRDENLEIIVPKVGKEDECPF